MKTHKILMIALTVIALALIVFGPALNVGIGFGLLCLLCPLMMLMMGRNHDRYWKGRTINLQASRRFVSPVGLYGGLSLVAATLIEG